MTEAPDNPGVIDPAVEKGIPGEGTHQKEKWANKMEFICSMAGEIIGLGNIWRFPYLCYKNGGGVFFIPYFVFFFFCGIPIFFLETALGQYTSESGLTAWRKICPLFQGIGLASQIIVTYLNIYYIVVLAWAIFYLYYSFHSSMPWSTCENWWNTDSCHEFTDVLTNPHLYQSNSSWAFLNNVTTDDYFEDYAMNETELFQMPSSAEDEFWINRVLRMSEDMSLVHIHWDLALCLLIAWLLCYFCIWKGIRSMGKVVYFTATFPYLLLVILFIRGVTLPGASEGLKYYLIPDISKITEPDVWFDAGTQVFFSYAVCQGVLTSLASYNKYNNNCYRDCLALCCLNSATSIFSGFLVFSVLGFLAHSLDMHMENVASSGPVLAFITFPKVLSRLPGSNFWFVLFFLLILFLGLDTQFVCVDSLATSISDLFPRQLRRPRARELLVLAIASSCFLLGLPLVSEGGIMLFHLMDTYGASGITLLFIACAETVVIGWVYGADRFYDNIEDMIGYRPLPFLKYCWLFVTPLICGLVLFYRVMQSSPLMVYNYQPGIWATIVGSMLTFLPLMCIPAFILISLCKQKGEGVAKPSSDLRQAKPHKPKLTLCGLVVFSGKAVAPSGTEMGINDKRTTEETTTGV